MWIMAPLSTFKAGTFMRGRLSPTSRGGLCALIDPSFTDAFTDASAPADAAAGNLFASSLLPYLAFLYFVGHPRVETPPTTMLVLSV